MKKSHLLSAILCFVATYGFAQDIKTDKIVKLNGGTIAAKVTMVTDHDISFVYPGEEAINVIAINQVKEVDFASGRIQELTKRVEIHGEDDWDKVTITTSPKDVQGLVAKGEIVAAVTAGTPFSSQQALNERSTEKLKRKAAKLGAHTVLLTNELVLGPAKTMKKGVAYGYQ